MAFTTAVNSAGIGKHFTEEQKFMRFYIRITKSDKQVCTLRGRGQEILEEPLHKVNTQFYYRPTINEVIKTKIIPFLIVEPSEYRRLFFYLCYCYEIKKCCLFHLQSVTLSLSISKWSCAHDRPCLASTDLKEFLCFKSERPLETLPCYPVCLYANGH